MILTDKFAYINKMAGVHPYEKIAFVFLMFIGTFLASSNTTLLAIFLIMVGTLLFKAEIPWKFLLRLYFLPIFFLVPAVIAIAIQPIALNQAVWGFQLAGYSLGISQEEVTICFHLTVRVIAAISCFYFLILTTPLTDLLLFLKKIKFPDLILELASLIYRFIFLTLDTSDKIRRSQESRLGGLTLKSRIRSLSTLMSNLFILTMNRSDMQYTAMEARCYNGSFHLLERGTETSTKNLLSIIAILGLLIFIEFFSRGSV